MMNPKSASPLAAARTLAANPAAVAMMAAAARHQSETSVKANAEEHAEKVSKAEVSIELGADGKQVVNAKGVPVEDFEDEQAKLYAAPQRQLAGIMNRVAATMDRDLIRKQLSSHEGRVRAAREIGGNWLTSRIDSRRLRLGRNSEDQAIDQVALARAAKLAQVHKVAGGIMDDARMQSNATRAETTAADNARRQQRKDVYGDIAKADLELLTLPGIAARTGVDVEQLANDPEVMNTVKARRDQLTLKLGKDAATKRRDLVVKLKKEDAEGGTFEQWRADAEAQAGQLTRSELAHAERKWKAFEGKIQDDLDREAARLRAEARAIESQERAERAAQRAEVALSRSADSADRAARGEERSIAREEKSEKRREIDRVLGDMEQTYSKMLENSKAFASSRNPSAKAELQRQNREMAGMQKAQLAELKKLRGGGVGQMAQPAPAPAAKPQPTSTASTTKFSPRQEAAITADMQANKRDRATSISRLRAAGLLPK